MRDEEQKPEATKDQIEAFVLAITGQIMAWDWNGSNEPRIMLIALEASANGEDYMGTMTNTECIHCIRELANAAVTLYEKIADEYLAQHFKVLKDGEEKGDAYTGDGNKHLH